MSDDYKQNPYWRARVREDGSIRTTAERDAYLAEVEKQKLFRSVSDAKRVREERASPTHNPLHDVVREAEVMAANAWPADKSAREATLARVRDLAAKKDAEIAAELKAQELAQHPETLAMRAFLTARKDRLTPDQVTELEAIAATWADDPFKARSEVTMRALDFSREHNAAASAAKAVSREQLLLAEIEDAKAAQALIQSEIDLASHEVGND